jgi:NAD(P)-dependent dehydrogenase (short-subunit alcohol dehydrogenase family)
MTASLFDISGKTALVTGGAKGVGRFIAEGLVRAGAKVYIASRDAEAGREAAAEMSKAGHCESLPADLSTLKGATDLAAALKAKEGKLHILVNNAGASEGGSIDSFSEEAWDRVMDLNVKAAFFLTQAMLPLLRAAAAPGDPARVVNLGSIAGTKAYASENYSYQASKAALHHTSRTLAGRLAKENITVNVIAPGPVLAGMLGRAATDAEMRARLERGIPIGRMADADDVAGAAIYLCSRAGAYLTGAVIPVDGGMTTCA